MKENDPLNYAVEPEDPFSAKMIRSLMYLIMGIALSFCLLTCALSSGCVTMAKEQYREMTATPIPTPTPAPPTPEPTPTPIPEPTLSPEAYRALHNGYLEREWLFWFRPDVSGLKDMRVFTTVYAHKFLPNYHYQSVSWGTRTYFKISPDPGYKFLFIFVNMYLDDTNGAQDTRMSSMNADHYYVQYNGTILYPDESMMPEVRIAELDNEWDYAHVASPRPYGYKIIQTAGSGAITAEYQDWLRGGRSNAMDGYVIFQVPSDAYEKDLTVLGRFENLGGYAYWELV